MNAPAAGTEAPNTESKTGKEVETSTDNGESKTPDPAVEKLTAELEKERVKAQRLFGELTTVKKDMERFKNIDPERVKATEEEVENLKREAAESSPEKMKAWKKEQEERIKGQADREREQLQKELAARDKAIQDLQAERKKLLITDKLIREHGSKVTPKGQRFFLEDANRALDLEDGEPVVRDANGNIEYSRAGVKMTHDEWVTRYLTENDILAAPSYNGGGQTPGTKPAAGTQSSTKTPQLPANWGSLNIDQRAEWMRKNPEAKGLFRV